jgi:putative hydrolase of the HAD superfamily
LDIYNIRKFFQEIIVSIELGIRKPRKELFHEILKRLKTRAHESVYIGDNPQVDVAGSKNAGLDVVWFNKKKEQLREDIPQPDYIIAHLRELLPIF